MELHESIEKLTIKTWDHFVFSRFRKCLVKTVLASVRKEPRTQMNPQLRRANSNREWRHRRFWMTGAYVFHRRLAPLSQLSCWSLFRKGFTITAKGRQRAPAETSVTEHRFIRFQRRCWRRANVSDRSKSPTCNQTLSRIGLISFALEPKRAFALLAWPRFSTNSFALVNLIEKLV